MANNIDKPFSDAEWQALSKEVCDAEVEVYVLRKDKMSLLVERHIPNPPAYITTLLAALLHLPKTCITKISVYVDGDSFP